MRANIQVYNSLSKMTTNPPQNVRRRPQQARSKETVEAILLGTAQILVAQGYDKLTTNRAAKAAGVSVGSLYQYFPNKKALVIALIQRHVNQAIDLLRKIAMELATAPVSEAVRAFVTNIMDLHEMEPELQRAITQLAMTLGLEHIAEHRETLRLVVETYLEAHRAEILPQSAPIAAYMVVNIVESALHGAHLPGQEWPRAELEPEVGDAVLRYLLGTSAQ